MRLDAEEGLAYDNERRDVEDKIRGQIMKIQPVVEHKPADEGMEWKSQSTDEVGEKHDPLVGSRGRNNLPIVW